MTSNGPLRSWIRALDYSKKHRNDVLPALLPMLAHGDDIALLDEHVAMTYADLNGAVDRYARWGLAHGLRGKTVGLLLHNCPAYFAIWVGLSRLGCVVALLNTNQSGDILRHSLDTADVAAVITSTALSANLGDDSRPRFLWSELAAEAPTGSLDGVPMPRPDDLALLIYTSGTTGLPKATRITHRRIVEWSYWFAGMINVQRNDRLYNCLPMYHSIGGIVAVGSMLVGGGSVVIRERFSASRFWPEIRDHHCTIFQYIGEICRYLLQSPQEAAEGEHQLRLAVGNGMQGTVWEPFQARFHIPQILEFYAATESGVSLYNCEGRVGSIGRIPPVLDMLAPKIIRCNPETGEVERDISGLCQPCDSNEVGEAIARLDQTRRFDGYTDAAASDRKVLRDVFEIGDRWFRTGDLMRRDAQGFYYFVDRLGDTFRWKGENVSTTEVEAALRQCTGVQDAVVYGIAVDGQEGRAGMAALITDSVFDIEQFHAEVCERLPEYARPMFVRRCDQFDLTGTFKLNKTQLAREALSNGNAVWTYDRKTGYHLLEN